MPELLLGAPLPGQRVHSKLSRDAPFALDETPDRLRALLRAYQINAAQYVELMRAERSLWTNGKPATAHVASLMRMLDTARTNHRRWLLSNADDGIL